MASDSHFPLSRKSLGLLLARGFDLDVESVIQSFEQYWSLSSTWNLSAKLMSTSDLADRFDDHIADSLSLAPYLFEDHASAPTLVDIGAGGGLPGIPLCLAFRNLSAIEVERSEVKATFLRQAVARLGLHLTRVQQENYPAIVLPDTPIIYTARAVEKPAQVDLEILKRLGARDVYLAQRTLPGVSEFPTLRVEKLDDEFTELGLRRGVLYRVRV